MIRKSSEFEPALEQLTLARAVATMRSASLRAAEQVAPTIEQVPEPHRASAANLAHYLGIRRLDIREVQKRLARRGLSSLGRCEAAVLPMLDAVLGNLEALDGPSQGHEDQHLISRPHAPTAGNVSGLEEGQARLDARSAAALGPRPAARAVRVMVTMPSVAADDPAFSAACAQAGMDLARINAAHDDADAWSRMLGHLHAAGEATGRPIRVMMDLPGPKLRVSRVIDRKRKEAEKVRIGPDESFLLLRAETKRKGVPKGSIGVGVTLDCALRRIRPGDRVSFDDGTIEARVERVDAAGAHCVTTRVPERGAKLRAGKGVNLPDTAIDVPAVSRDDLAVLDRFGDRVDLVALSFARSPEDVEQLLDALMLRGLGHVGVVLKVETREGFERLPELLMVLLRWPVSAVMVARGDLAVECGFERLAEVQEQVMWLCEASHTPAIWATQVLEGLAKQGRPTRAEITDAAMGQRAECVMLNKGPHVLDAVRVLDDLLRRMAPHQRKKTPMMRALGVAQRTERRTGQQAVPEP